MKDTSTDLSLEKLPPHDKEAEQSVLGACIHSSDAFYKSIQILLADDFYKSNHRIIYSSMWEWFHANKTTNIDVLTLADSLKSRGKLEEIGGLEYLSKLEDYVPTATAVMHHSQIVKHKSIARAVIRMSSELLSLAYSNHLSPEELLGRVNSEALKLENPQNDDISDYNAIMQSVLHRLEDGEVRVLTLTGSLLPEFGGDEIAGEDVVVIKKPRRRND